MDCTCHTKLTPSTTCAGLCIRQRRASVVAAVVAVAAVGASGAAVGGAAVAAAGLVAAAVPYLLLTLGRK